MALLSSALTNMKPRYDVVVVGSGYGGSITASRLARARRGDGSALDVCLLEMGEEIPVGSFPSTLSEAAPQFHVNTPSNGVGKENGLYQLHKSDDISVFHGCGLGGTSLVNANVSLPPEDRLWDDPAWPGALREDVEQGIEEGFERAKKMLRPVPYPEDGPNKQPELDKYQALTESARGMGHGRDVYRPPINVTFEDGRNHVGVKQEACVGCGDCVSGCNYASKNTLMMNYLPDARNHGAQIFCGVSVRYVIPDDEGWRVYYRPMGYHRDRFDDSELFVRADAVVISAGTLGTTEILLRSRKNGLDCSDRLGEKFTGNGDVLGFGYNNDRRINGIGMGDRPTDPDSPPGPCITGIIDLREQDKLEQGYVIEEGTIPGPVSTILPASFRAASAMLGQDTDEGWSDWLSESLRSWTSVFLGAYRGAVQNTQTYLIMAHDDGSGRLSLEDDRLSIQWPKVGEQPLFKDLNESLREATKVHGGIYIPSPLFNKVFGYDLVTVHPMGGCVMADSASNGVVNHKGQVFAGTKGEAVYEDLYCSDGSVIPRPLGVNPLLTISAVAERNVKLMARDRGWSLDYELTDQVAEYDGMPEGGDAIRLHFTERMTGHCSTQMLEDYQDAEEAGRNEDSECSFVFTILTEDLDRMIEETSHRAGLLGSVRIPALSSEPLTASHGEFNLFVEDEDDERIKKMRYAARLHSAEGETFYFDGFKVIRDDPGMDMWEDTTTLYVTLHEGVDNTGPLRARGILHIEEEDFARQMTTMEARDPDGSISVEGTVKFGKFFAGSLWETYGPSEIAAERSSATKKSPSNHSTT